MMKTILLSMVFVGVTSGYAAQSAKEEYIAEAVQVVLRDRWLTDEIAGAQGEENILNQIYLIKSISELTDTIVTQVAEKLKEFPELRQGGRMSNRLKDDCMVTTYRASELFFLMHRDHGVPAIISSFGFIPLFFTTSEWESKLASTLFLNHFSPHLINGGEWEETIFFRIKNVGPIHNKNYNSPQPCTVFHCRDYANKEKNKRDVKAFEAFFEKINRQGQCKEGETQEFCGPKKLNFWQWIK